MKDYKTYYVTYACFYDGRYHLNSRDFSIYVEDGLKPGETAKMLEDRLSDTYQDNTIVIINYWEM